MSVSVVAVGYDLSRNQLVLQPHDQPVTKKQQHIIHTDKERKYTTMLNDPR